jgi:hypothetical protein
MEKSLSAFRVFDLAFFAPGAVVFWSLWTSDLLPRLQVSDELTTAETAVTVVGFVALVFFLGVICHGVQRLLYDRLRPYLPDCSARKDQQEIARRALGKQPPRRWFEKVDRKTRFDLATYFWYLRTTCWNSAVAVPVGYVICVARRIFWADDWAWAALSAMCAVTAILLYLGWDFHKALQDAVATGRRQREEPSSAPQQATEQ